MLDVNGLTLELEDKVVFDVGTRDFPYGLDRLVTATVCGFTPKRVRIEVRPRGYLYQFLVNPKDVSKIVAV